MMNRLYKGDYNGLEHVITEKEVSSVIIRPKKDTLIQLTIVVISISIIISLILGGFDYLFTQGIALLGNL